MTSHTYRVEFTDELGTVLPRLFIPPTRDALDGDIARMETLLTARATKIVDVTASTSPEIAKAKRRASAWRTFRSRWTILAS